MLGALARHPRTSLLAGPTPLQDLPRLGATLGIQLAVKRDDLTGIAFGGNKARQLEFVLGKALSVGADTVLVSGAVQSNATRALAACAPRLGLKCHVQLEERIGGIDDVHRRSGNVLASRLFGATMHTYAGHDELGAEASLQAIAQELAQQGRRPFTVFLGPGHLPLASLGYVAAAHELLEQMDPSDHLLLASGSGQTQAGLLFGLRALGWKGSILGICVRRAAVAQAGRVAAHCRGIATLLDMEDPVVAEDIDLHDSTLAPGYGVMNDAVALAIKACARIEGLLLDPAYTGRAMAGLVECVRTRRIPQGARVVFLHTGGLPALFAYQTDLEHYGLLA